MGMGHRCAGATTRGGSRHSSHAADGFHLWKQNYDRPLDDICKIQHEIAAAVVDRLKMTLPDGR